MPLTRRQSEILKYLQEHIRDRGYAPSFEEIAEQFGFQSLATVHEHLTNLERKGYIHRTHNESRAIEVLPPKVNDILQITQLITVFEVYDSEDEALATF